MEGITIAITTPAPDPDFTGVTSSVGSTLADFTGLITDNLPAVLGVAALILGATVVWALVRRFVR